MNRRTGERAREREGERDGDTDRQTDRQRQSDRYTYEQTNIRKYVERGKLRQYSTGHWNYRLQRWNLVRNAAMTATQFLSKRMKISMCLRPCTKPMKCSNKKLRACDTRCCMNPKTSSVKHAGRGKLSTGNDIASHGRETGPVSLETKSHATM